MHRPQAPHPRGQPEQTSTGRTFNRHITTARHRRSARAASAGSPARSATRARSWVILSYGGPCGADRPRWPWPHALRSASRYRTWALSASKRHALRLPSGLTVRYQSATAEGTKRTPKVHRKRRFQSGQSFGLGAPRATRSSPGASPHCHGERRVLRFECSDTLRLAAVHEPMGAPRATPCDSGVRHWWTYPRDAAANFAFLDVSALVTGGRARAGSAPAEKGTPTHRPATAGRGPAYPAGAVVPAATACRVGRRRRAAAPCSGPTTGLGAHAASLAAQRRAGARLRGGRMRAR